MSRKRRLLANQHLSQALTTLINFVEIKVTGELDHDKWLGAKAMNTASMLSICIFGDPVTWSGSRPGGLGCECPGW